MGLGIAWRLARRELRGGLRGFGVFLACLTLGVGAIAAVGVINAGLLEGIERDAAALFGGDVRIEAVNLPLEPAEIDALTPPGAARSDIVQANAMVGGPEGRRLVTELKAVGDAYPLYGTVRLDPPGLSLEDALADAGALVERGVLARLGIAIGDPIRIGEAEFTVSGVIEREPDRVGGYIGIGPRVMIAQNQLERTGVIQPGSLARYSYLFALPPGEEAEAVLERLTADHPDARWRARGARDVQPRIARVTDRLATYLTLAGMTALLIGGLGIGLAIHNYLAGKTSTIASLKGLGAQSRLIFLVYLLQVLTLATAGVALGVLLGQLAPSLLRFLPDNLVPVEVVVGFYPVPLAIAAGCGLLTTFVFAIWPLARAQDVSPAGMFRALITPPQRWPRPVYLWALAAAVLGLAGLAVVGVASPQIGLVFVLAALVAALLLAALAQGVLRLLRRLRGAGGARLRMAIANLHRPGAGAVSVVVALGAGLAVLTLVALVQRNLAAEVEMHLPDRAPAIFFIDIQPDQLDAFREEVAATPGGSITQEAPLIRGRVVRIQGVPVDETGVEHWSLRRDRGLSYAAAEPDHAELAAGAWWPEDYQGPPLVSVEDDVAEAYGVGVGDTLAFNVLGRVIEAEIANLRAEIDWSEARLDFVFILSPGLIEAAPHTFAAAVEVPAEAEPGLLDRLAERLPNVTPISVREIVARVQEVLQRIEIAIDAVGGITLLSGVLVLAGAVAAARRRHLYEAVVLKVLGATRADLLRVFLLEYAGLGLAAALVGGALGTLGAWVVVVPVMGLEWTFALWPVLRVLIGAILLTLVAGFLGTWRLLGRPAAAVLRSP